MRISLITQLVMLFILSSCAKKIPYKSPLIKAEESNRYLISDVSIFNGKDSILQEGMDVYINYQTIEKIVPHNSEKAGEKYQRIDGKQKILCPGFIDAHVHLSGNGSVPWKKFKSSQQINLDAYLYAGVTSIYDLGGIAPKLEKLSNKIAKGKKNGPQLFHTHIPITVKNSHPIPITKEMMPFPLNKMVNMIAPTISKATDAEKLVRSYKKKKADYIKLTVDQMPPGSPEMPYPLLKALIEETHNQGMKAFVHIGSPQNAVDAVNAGADVLAHGIWRGKLSEEQAEIIAKSCTPIVYTLAGLHNVVQIQKQQFQASDFDSLLVPNPILNTVILKNGADFDKKSVAIKGFFQDAAKNESNIAHNLKLLKKKGVRILVGTDSTLPGTYAGSTYMQELSLLHEYGLSVYEILRAATFENAHIFLDNPDFGFIKAGNRADLLLLDADALRNIQKLFRPSMIMAGGKLIQRQR